MHHATNTMNTTNLAARSEGMAYGGGGLPLACTVEEGAGPASKHGISCRAAASAGVQATADHGFVSLVGRGRPEPLSDGTVDSTEIIQENHYYAFGMEMNGGWQKVLRPEQRYGYNGIEHCEKTGLDLAFYRSYDPALGRWMQNDPLAESFANLSGYSGMGNNPIVIIDPLGDSIDVFAPDGTYAYTYDDGKKEVTGYYVQDCSENCDGEESYSGIHFSYNDPENDRDLALSNTYNFIVISDSDVNQLVGDAIKDVGDGVLDHYNAGKAQGAIDFWGKRDSPIRGNTLYVVSSARGGTGAYNPNDFGNYLTGQSLRRLGYGLGEVRLGAHINHIVNGRQNYGSWLEAGIIDSNNDQRAIHFGYYHFNATSKASMYGSFGQKY